VKSVPVPRQAERRRRAPQPSRGVYFWSYPYPVFEAVRYGKIHRDTARYSWLQLDTHGYLDTVGQWISAAKLLDMDRYTGTQRDAKDTV